MMMMMRNYKEEGYIREDFFTIDKCTLVMMF